MLETAEFAPRSRKTLLCPPIYSSLLRRCSANTAFAPACSQCFKSLRAGRGWERQGLQHSASRCRPPPGSGSRFPSGRSGHRSRRRGFAQGWRQRNLHLEVERRFSVPGFILLSSDRQTLRKSYFGSCLLSALKKLCAGNLRPRAASKAQRSLPTQTQSRNPGSDESFVLIYVKEANDVCAGKCMMPRGCACEKEGADFGIPVAPRNEPLVMANCLKRSIPSLSSSR